jgi:cytochrome c oxidase cbb3-type subunit 3
MADFTNGFWDWYIVVLTLLGIIGCGVLLYSQSKVKLAKTADGNGTTGHVWDEDLTELNTPLPRWWMWLFYITIVFGLAYLFLYPGLGTTPASWAGLPAPPTRRTEKADADSARCSPSTSNRT